MKIGTISHHGCIRMHKMNLALINKAHELHLVTSQVTSFRESYKSYLLAHDIEQVRYSLKHLSREVDFLHVHNEPSWYVSVWKELTDKPVILDVHDSYLARTRPEDSFREDGKPVFRISVEERNNFMLADALVFPSEPFADLICKEFGLKQPRLILPSYVPEMFTVYGPKHWFGGAVYEGKTSIKKDPPQFQYCNYTEMATQFRQAEIELHVFGGRWDDAYKQEYEDAVVHKPCLFKDLLPYLARHEWGIVGNVAPSPEWEVAFPNKVFEYIAAGIPVVAMNAPAVSTFLEETGFGITVGSVEELKKRWREHNKCRETVLKNRQRYSMDSQIHHLESFYKSVYQRQAGTLIVPVSSTIDNKALAGILSNGHKEKETHHESDRS